MIISDMYYAYVADIIKLTRSIVIKSEHTIKSLNSFLLMGGDSLSSNPSDWKYYKDLAGELYVGTSGLFNTPAMQVYSLDTDALVPFTAASMVNHPVTLAEFKTFGTAYTTLLAKYPREDAYIRGVLNPIDKATALNAADYTILGYDSSLVGEGEQVVLIQDLQNWIYQFMKRWDIRSFAVTDTLYPAYMLSILYSNIVAAIIHIRLTYCRTEHVHEFHLWNYLGGYFHLDKYKGVLPYAQALFLYRNIDYIVANAGKKETLDFLNEGFCRPFGLELFVHDVEQNAGTSLDLLLAGTYGPAQSNSYVKIAPYGDNQSSHARYIPPETLVRKIASQATLNPENMAYDVEQIQEGMLHTPMTSVPTNVIECDIVKSSAVAMVNADDEKIHNWFYLTSIDMIRYKISVTLPAENLIGLTLGAKDAAVILLYCATTLSKLPIGDIPQPRVLEIMTAPALSVGRQKGLIESQYLSGTIEPSHLQWDRYTDLLNAQTLPVELLSLKAFTTYINHVVTNKVQHKLLLGLEPTSVGKSELDALVHSFYNDPICVLAPEVTYVDFFKRLGLNISNFAPSSLVSLAAIIIRDFIGVDPVTTTLQHPYSDMVEILRIISSYLMQYVEGSATNSIVPIDWTFLDFTLTKFSVNMGTTLFETGSDGFGYVASMGVLTYRVNHELGPTLTSRQPIVLSCTHECGVDLSIRTSLTFNTMLEIGTWPELY